MVRGFLQMGCVGCAALFALVLFSGCEEDVTPTSISHPTLTMTLPDSLTNQSGGAGAYTAGAGFNAVTDPDTECDFGSESDPFNNGYTMTKFLVGLSQGQSCFADFLIGIITTQGLPWVNQGLLAVGDGADGDPTHIQIVQSGDGSTFTLWLYFDGAGVTPGLYLTWTTSGADTTGQMIWIVAANAASQTEPDAVRVDFSRTSNVDTNQLYIRFPETNEGSADGFRAEVTATESSGSTTYEAKGLINLTGQWEGNSLPAGEDFDPASYSMVTVSDEDGMGASIASFIDAAIDTDNGQSAPDDLDFGSYQFTLEDRAYFKATGTEEWRNKNVTAARYVNTSGTNSRSGTSLGTFIDCLEDTDCTGFGIPDLQLGTNYFTSSCGETDGDDCTDFIDAIFQEGLFGGNANSTDPEPSGDFRMEALNAATQITEVWPTGLDRTTTFDIPAP